MRINARNRRMNLLLCAGLLFLAIGIITAAFVNALEITTESMKYTLYRYMAVGQYASLPVNYVYLMSPAILAGAVGLVLCLCYFMGNRKKGFKVKKQHLIGLGALLLVGCVFLLAGVLKKEKPDDENLYGNIIAELGDEEQFSLRDIGEKNNVLFTTDMTYDDGNGHNAALYCNVYYPDDGVLYPLDRIESMGTAYPVSYGKKCIYTASLHSLVVYRFDQKKKQWTVSWYEESFDENGDASYRYIEDGETKNISEKEYLDAWEDYGKSTVVNFGYGASDNQF